MAGLPYRKHKKEKFGRAERGRSALLEAYKEKSSRAETGYSAPLKFIKRKSVGRKEAILPYQKHKKENQ